MGTTPTRLWEPMQCFVEAIGTKLLAPSAKWSFLVRESRGARSPSCGPRRQKKAIGTKLLAPSAKRSADPQPETRNPKPSTLNPQPSTLNPEPHGSFLLRKSCGLRSPSRCCIRICRAMVGVPHRPLLPSLPTLVVIKVSRLSRQAVCREANTPEWGRCRNSARRHLHNWAFV